MMKKIPKVAAFILGAASLIGGVACAQSTPQAGATLRSAYDKQFLMGVALNTAQVDGRIPRASEIAARQFSSLTAENDMKW